MPLDNPRRKFGVPDLNQGKNQLIVCSFKFILISQYMSFSDYDPVDKITMSKFHSIGGVNVEVKIDELCTRIVITAPTSNAT